MKKNNLSAVAIAVAIAGALTAGQALAATQVIYLNAGGQADTSANASVSGAAANVNVSGSLGNGSSSVNTAGSASSTASNNDSGSAILNVSGGDVRGMSTVDMRVSSPAQVQTSDDLQSYAQVLARQDASVDSVVSDTSSVNVVFARPAHLFGFIPVTIKDDANVSVDANGKLVVSVNKPWWSFLASGNFQEDQVKAKIENAVAAMNNSVQANASLTASQKAEILSAIADSETSVYATSTASVGAGY